jgi:hypothetical protein
MLSQIPTKYNLILNVYNLFGFDKVFLTVKYFKLYGKKLEECVDLKIEHKPII